MDFMERERERDRHRAVERLRGLGANNGKPTDDLDSDRSSSRLSDRDMYDRLSGIVLDNKRSLENVGEMDGDRGTYEKVDELEFKRDSKGQESLEDKSSLKFAGRVNVLERMRALDREREEERERLRERGRDDERDAEKERGSRDELLQELVSQYKTALGELTFNSKPIITNLTIIAGENVHAAKGIATTVCSHILEVPKEQKLPSLYLLDSIVKNIGGDYVRYFAVRLPEVFCRSYKQVDLATHPAMQHLFRTWRGVFPASALRRIEVELEFAPQLHGPSPSTLQTKSVDSSSQRTGHGIHVNPKYIEAQRQRLQQTSRVEGVPVEDAEPRELERSAVRESTKEWPDTAPSQSMARYSQRVGSFDKVSLGQDSASEHSDQNVVLESPGVEVASRRSMDRGIFRDRKWPLEREELGKHERASDALSSQRNGFDWRMPPARGTKLEELRSSGLGPLFSQSSDAIDLSRRSIGNWPNSEEEGYVWDEVSSSREREHDAGVERRDDWNPSDLDKGFRNAGLAREKWPKLQSEFSETLNWRRYSTPPCLDLPLGFDEQLPSFQELDNRLHHSSSHLIKGIGGLQDPITGVDVLAIGRLQPGHHSHAVQPPISTLQHLGPPAQSRLRSLQVTVPSRSASAPNVNPGYLAHHLDSATRSPPRLGSMLFRPSSSLQKLYETNIGGSLGMGFPTAGNLSPVTPASNVAFQSLPHLKPILPSFSITKFSSQHVPHLPPIPPPPNPPTSQHQVANTINPSHNLTQVLPFQHPNSVRPIQVAQPFCQSQGVPPLQEVTMPGQTLQGPDPPQLSLIQRPHGPLSVSSVPEVPRIQTLPPQQPVEGRKPLQDAQPQQTLQPIQPPSHVQQSPNLQAFQTQPTQPLNNVVSGVQFNGPGLAPPSAPQDQPNKENLLAALLKSGLMPPVQSTLLQSHPQPSSSMAIASFTPSISTPLQAPPPLPACPPFQFSAPIVNSMTVQAFSSSLASSNTITQPTSAGSLGTFSLQPTRNPQPPLPPGPPPFTPIVSGAMQTMVLGEPGSVNQISSLLSSLVARGFITAPVSTTGVTVTSAPLPPQTFLPVLQSSDFSFVSTDVAQVSAVGTSTTSIVTTTSISTSAVNAPADSDISQSLDVIGIEFKQDILKERHESVIMSLYSDFPRQCKTCGLRFHAQEDHSKHMDWHVARNRRQKSQKPISRQWFVSVKEWLGGTGVSAPVVAPFFAEETETKIEEEETLAVPADENQNTCALCEEPFEDFFSDETEEWMYKGAVYLNVSPGSSAEDLDSVLRGPIVHAKCKSESAATAAGIDSSEDLKEEVKDEFRSRKRVRY